MLIFKLFRKDEWLKFKASGRTDGAPIDVSDGFIHFSKASQLKETAAKHFKGEKDLVLVSCDADNLKPDLKWEISRGGDFSGKIKLLLLPITLLSNTSSQ